RGGPFSIQSLIRWSAVQTRGRAWRKETREMRFRRKFAVGIVAASVFAFGGIALAASSFEDVPDDHVFSQDIAWLAENGITKGCNPPDNTRFCPDDPVTRGQMAAFMHRFA